MEKKPICQYCVVEFPHEPTPECLSSVDQISQSIGEAVSAVMGRPQKAGNEFTDAESSGRKRAAALLPTEQLETMICEWALLKEAGGGVNPIRGCHGNRATDRHHGPDKNTLNNERQVNLHGICAFCHNEWHAKNDDTYSGERPKGDEPWIPDGEFSPHNPDGEKMTIKEALANEILRYK